MQAVFIWLLCFAMETTRDLLLAHHLADRATEIAMSVFGGKVSCRVKADDSLVSDVDIAVEREIISLISRERPGDGVLAEESGDLEGASQRRWIIDPIDGTSSFLEGRKSWGTHVSLEVAGRLQLAIMTRPTEGRRWWAVAGNGAYASDDRTPLSTARRLQISMTRSLAGARVGGLVEPDSADALRLRNHCTWVDDEISIVAALLEGRVDAVLDDAGKAWDQAPPVLLVKEAGGFFRDPLGGERFDMGWGLYGSPYLEQELVEVLLLDPAAK